MEVGVMPQPHCGRAEDRIWRSRVPSDNQHALLPVLVLQSIIFYCYHSLKVVNAWKLLVSSTEMQHKGKITTARLQNLSSDVWMWTSCINCCLRIQPKGWSSSCSSKLKFLPSVVRYFYCQPSFWKLFFVVFLGEDCIFTFFFEIKTAL